jgi:hypothetical protein
MLAGLLGPLEEFPGRDENGPQTFIADNAVTNKAVWETRRSK